MLDKIAEFFWRIAGWKTFLPALMIYAVIGGCILYTWNQKMVKKDGTIMNMLDKQFSYTPDTARTLMTEYGDTGRSFAWRFELIADGLYPISYTFLFLIIISWTFKSLAPYGFSIRYIHLFPFLVMLFDYSENACIIRMLKTFPDFSDNLVQLSSFFTSLKWSLLVAETFMIGAALWLLTFYRMKRGRMA
jgi:hypothetical protein